MGEFPKPPNLFKGKGVTDDPVGVIYWKVANGILLTGDARLQQLPSAMIKCGRSVSLLLNADKLPPAVRTTLQAPLPQAQY